MESGKECLCYQCTHFAEKLDNTGYCELYCCAVSEQKEKCSGFVEKDISDEKKRAVIPKPEFVISDGEDSKSMFKNISLLIALFGCSIFFLVLFFICVCLPTFSLNINSSFYSLFVLLMTVLFFGLMTLSFFLIGRYMLARIIYIIVPIPILILMLVNYDSFWFAVSDFIITLFSRG